MNIQIALVRSIVNVLIADMAVNSTAADSGFIVVKYTIIATLRLSKYTALNIQFAIIIIFYSNFTTSSLRKITIQNGHYSILFGGILAAVIPAIVDKARKCTVIGVREFERALMNIHRTYVIDNIVRVTTTTAFTGRCFCATGIYNFAVQIASCTCCIVYSSFTIGHIVNRTCAIDGKLSVVGNGMACTIGNCLTI